MNTFLLPAFAYRKKNTTGKKLLGGENKIGWVGRFCESLFCQDIEYTDGKSHLCILKNIFGKRQTTKHAKLGG